MADVIIGYRADDNYFSFAKDFLNNGAQAATVTILALALGCAVEDLLERRYNPRTRRMI